MRQVRFQKRLNSCSCGGSALLDLGLTTKRCAIADILGLSAAEQTAIASFQPTQKAAKRPVGDIATLQLRNASTGRWLVLARCGSVMSRCGPAPVHLLLSKAASTPKCWCSRLPSGEPQWLSKTTRIRSMAAQWAPPGSLSPSMLLGAQPIKLACASYNLPG